MVHSREYCRRLRRGQGQTGVQIKTTHSRAGGQDAELKGALGIYVLERASE